MPHQQQRLQGCRSLHLNEDNGRFLLLALLIVLYLLCGAAVFSAVERPSELRAHGRWSGTLRNFSEAFNISVLDLNSLLRDWPVMLAAPQQMVGVPEPEAGVALLLPQPCGLSAASLPPGGPRDSCFPPSSQKPRGETEPSESPWTLQLLSVPTPTNTDGFCRSFSLIKSMT
ncbi:hypothetical protein NHX12_022969 [Muraenolepis orangiensis]|uniref:Uncharacterized protein n=1 Tax=Muraenolepis orangiensis TaxID=630683 RepID=A0A9Q0EPG8_9TELE|nr:hypothetical protein NHX12_022969 [Muraenolepis orangiensis]